MRKEADRMLYDALIVGGGIAGLQAAIQLGRYGHRVLVLDKGDGRSKLCRKYGNLLGWPEGISGEELRARGRRHAARYGVAFREDEITRAGRIEDGGFVLEGAAGRYEGRAVLFATGVADRFPDLPGMIPCLGRSIFICPDCDGYEARNRRTLVIGAGAAGARMALTLAYWCRAGLTLVNHEPARPVPEPLLARLRERRIAAIDGPAVSLEQTDGFLQAVRLEDGTVLRAGIAFVALGGAQARTELARELGVERLENGHALSDPRSKMSNVPGVWIAGDIGVHAELVSVAMGEGMLAAVWMHKYLLGQRPTGAPPHEPSAFPARPSDSGSSPARTNLCETTWRYVSSACRPSSVSPYTPLRTRSNQP
jgi:thioredoxin reductase